MKLPMAILSIGTLVFGLFPTVVMKYILRPVMASILNIDLYINEELNIGSNESINTELKLSGIYYSRKFFNIVIVCF